MGSGAEFRDFGNAFAAASRGRWKSKAEREQQAIQLEEAKLRLEALKRAAETYPEDRAIELQMRQQQLEINKLNLDAARKKAADEAGHDPGSDPDWPNAKSGVPGPGSELKTPNPGLAGGEANDLMNEPGDAHKTYVSPVTGVFAGKASSQFGAGRYKRFHAGVDLQAANGSTVVAAYPGVVLGTNYDPGSKERHTIGYQHELTILGDDGYIYRYAPHGSVSVKRGQRVAAGDPIGTIGSGHLHWEVIPPGSPNFKTFMRGGFARTVNKGANAPTVNPTEFFGVQPGMKLTAGEAFSTGGKMVARGIPRPGMVGAEGTDQLNDGGVDMSGTTGARTSFNLPPKDINNPELPGSQYQRDVHKYDPEDTNRPTAIPSPTGAPAVGTSASTLAADIARATGRTGQEAPELPSGVTVNAVAPTSMRGDKPTGTTAISADGAPATGVSASTLPRISSDTIVDRVYRGKSGYSNEGGSKGQQYGGRGLKDLSSEDRQAVLDVSSQLGIAPSHLLSVIGYETMGTYSTDITSPTGYKGLIQFGPREQKKFGVKSGMSFSEQLRGPVTDYLKQRGLKPGMGLPELYSIINAGSLTKDGQPRWGAADANGDLRHHLTLISKNYAPGAMAWLGDTQLSTTSAVGLEGKVIPTPRSRPETGLPSETVIPPRSPIIPPISGLGTTAIPAPGSNPATAPTISPISSMQTGGFGGFGGGFQSATGRMGSPMQNLELPQPFRMARGGVVPSNDDIARATGRTGQLAMELPGDAPVASSIEDRRSQPPVPPPHDYSSDYSPGDGLDTQRGPDVNFSPGGQDPGVDDGYDPYASVLDTGHFAVRKATESILGVQPDLAPDPGLSGEGGTDAVIYGGAAGDTVAPPPGGETDDGSGDTPSPVTTPADTSTGDTAIPAPGTTWDKLPAATPTDYDVAKYIADAEKRVDPDHTMGESQRHLAAIGMVYRYFRDTKHDSRAAMESARDFVNYLSQQHSQYQAIAEEAIASGDMDGALKAAVKSWNSIPDGADISVDKEHNGFRVTYKDAKGAVVHEALMTPDQIAAQILGMTPKTYWDQIVSAAGGHQPSKEFSAALEKLNRTGTITSEELAKVRDSKEVRFLVKHEEDLHTVRAGQDAEEKAASEKTRREVSAEINKAYAKNKTLPTRDQLAGADDATRNIFTPLLDKADKEVDKNSHKATLQKAFDEYNTTGHVSSATAVDVAAIDGGQEALDKFISENEAADKAKRDAANADRAAAGENRAAADAALKESQMPGGPPTTQETNDSGVAEAATGVVGKIEAAVPDRSVVVFDPPAAARVNDLVTNIWAWNRTRIQGAAPVADFVGQYLAMPNPDFAYAVRVNGPNTTVQSLNDGMMWVMPNGAYTQLKQLNGKVAATNTAEAAHKREQAQPPPTAPAGNVVDPYTNPSVTSRLPPPEARPSTAGPAVAPPVPFNPDPMHRRMPPRPAGP